MGQNKVDNHFLEGFLDIATELLAYSKNQNNRATPSLNDFDQSNQPEQNIIISNEEADQILDILNELQDQIEGKEEKINQLESELNQKENISKPKEKLENKRDYHPDSDFEAELREHAENLDLIAVVVQSGSNCCDLLVNVFRVSYK
jgi:septal ring factor EnvC (AmiA/AmiB activator)